MAILRLLLQKGEDSCQKFISLVLKDPVVQETYPRLEAMDWASLDSPPPPFQKEPPCQARAQGIHARTHTHNVLMG